MSSIAVTHTFFRGRLADAFTLLAANYFAHSKTDADFILGVKRIAKR